MAFTLPSMAGTAPSGRAAAKSPVTADGIAPQVLKAMQRDLGISSDQASTRLKRQAWASKVSSPRKNTTGLKPPWMVTVWVR